MSWAGDGEARLRDAARAFDRARVEDVCAELVAYLREGLSLEPGAATRVPDLLRRMRYPRLLRRVADALVQAGHDTPAVRRGYAQALLDEEQLTAAGAVLDGLAGTGPDEDPAETAGLRGRLHKQLFVHTGAGAPARRAEHLARAVREYHDAYRDDETRTWHGVNVVALLARAEREEIDAGLPGVTAAGLAERVLRVTLAEEDGRNPWRWATAFEAQLALGRPDRAVEHLERWVAEPGTRAFDLAGTLRQIEEVWGLRADAEPGATILPRLRSALLAKEGGVVTLMVPDLRGTLREAGDRQHRDLDRAGFRSLDWMAEGVRRCAAVARLDNDLGERTATGFLVEGAPFGETSGPVLLTNGHVVPETMRDDMVQVRFRGLAGGGEHATRARLLWSSPSDDLDAAVLMPDSVPPGVDACVLAAGIPEPERGRGGRALVVGHPEGADRPMFSLENNALLDVGERRVQYSASTRHGSSGSPVFDEDWRLIALHHRGGDLLPRLGRSGAGRANEGIRVDAVARAFRDRRR